MKLQSCKVTKAGGKGTKVQSCKGTEVEGVCEVCRFSGELKGASEGILVCGNRKGSETEFCVVEATGGCANFDDQGHTPEAIAAALAGGEKIIELTWGKVAIVDAEDFDRLSSYKWCAVKGRRNWYAKTLRLNGMPLAMHRLILGAQKGLVVDHRDHNGLNNRKTNLRLCTKRQNDHNRRPRAGKTSRYKGVYWNKGAKKFVAQIYIKGKKIWLGYFTDEIEAAKAYDKKAAELFGEFAYLNFPEDTFKE